eukprot:Opistho-2@76720
MWARAACCRPARSISWPPRWRAGWASAPASCRACCRRSAATASATWASSPEPSPYHGAMTPLRLLLACVLACLTTGGQADQAQQPEAASGFQAKPGWASERFSVAAAHPLAVDAGYELLRAGGSALDAAIAVQLVLGLVEPQSSGIGGGAFLMHWDGRELQAWDGRETAPAGARPEMFLRPDGRAMSVGQVMVGGLSVATPGVLAMLAAAHEHHGLLPWARLLEPAIRLAEQGFPVGPRLHALLSGEQALRREPQAAAYFYDERKQPWPVGHRLRNPAMAEILRGIAARGAEAFYRGPVATDIARRVQGHARPGTLAANDLAAYRPLQREALCAHVLC